jgi:hypothetical protein
VRPRPALRLALIVLFAAPTALGLEGTPSDPASAEVLFRAGRALVDAGDYHHACEKFAESLRLERASGTLLNLADCEEHTGRIATAWAHYRDLSSELSSTDERRPVAVQRANALEARMPHLTLRFSGSLGSRTKIVRDDVELGEASLGVALPVDPGVHSVVVTDSDRELFRTEVEVLEGQSRTIVANLSEPGHAKSTSSATGTAAWITGGLALAAFATGAAFGGTALSSSSAADAQCTGDGVCGDTAGARAYDDARAEARIADVALGVGLVATLATAVLFFEARRSSAPLASSAPRGSLRFGGVAW